MYYVDFYKTSSLHFPVTSKFSIQITGNSCGKGGNLLFESVVENYPDSFRTWSDSELNITLSISNNDNSQEKNLEALIDFAKKTHKAAPKLAQEIINLLDGYKDWFGDNAVNKATEAFVNEKMLLSPESEHRINGL